ncbi:MAG: hypothetical protein VE99_C0001G0515 [candidate division Kazan bacterium GW2011_GWC1_52_13]|nr:MAG: hypothetical protein VE99_C0001G0515 [candidate division Kazan bacterium GW2011_GWC1_52_13]
MLYVRRFSPNFLEDTLTANIQTGKQCHHTLFAVAVKQKLALGLIGWVNVLLLMEFYLLAVSVGCSGIAGGIVVIHHGS